MRIDKSIDNLIEIKTAIENLQQERKEILAELQPYFEKTDTLTGTLGKIQKITQNTLTIKTIAFFNRVSLTDFKKSVKVPTTNARKFLSENEINNISEKGIKTVYKTTVTV